MFKQLWQKWTIDKPAAFGDLLWEILVVQLAAFLDRLPLRRTIATVLGLAILFLAYAHQIALPPEVVLVGDVLAYIDIISVILLLGIVGRISTVWLFARQAAEHAVELAGRVLVCVQHFDFRRGKGEVRTRRRSGGRAKLDDEHPAFAGVAWA
jgi:hypothetical protein